MFSTSNGQRSGSAVFVTEGYRNWKKALQKDSGLRLHSNSAAHKLCQALWASFKQMKEKGAENSVSVHLSEAYLKELVAKSDAIVLKKLENGPANAKYTHHSVQDEILSAMSDMVLRRFKTEVDSAQCFALIVDESRDISKTEQLSVVVRCGIHLKNCIAQTYDGASVMSGKSKGVQALLKLEVPQALYVHCFNHRLNLVIVDACKSFDSARTFFSLIEMLYVFLGGSATHALFITVQKQVCGTTIEPKGISETRWTCQINACKAVLHALPAIIVTLTKIAEGGRSRSAEARGILHQLNFTFVSHLSIFSELLGELQILSDYQNKNCDLTHASMMVSVVLDRFRYLRTSEGFSSIWSQCLSVAETNGIRLVEERRINRLPAHLAKYLTEAQLPGEDPSYSTENDCRVHVFLPILDRTCEELKRRFSDSDLILKGLNCFQPQHDRFMDISLVEPFAKHYSSDWDALVAEMNLLPRESYRLCVIALTIPASSAACERTFSCLRRLKTYFRYRMSDKRLANLVVLAVEKSTAKSLELDDVVNAFDGAHHNRRIRLH
ncbi:zinc finger MYM-type protein 1-like [Ixodes scapularis]|uniref:zinc finger MYM-type protein 1-like n=1 Tax=Ixodes scapularis TaxID=6945 RepID=UPI001A9CD539|nr:zinc finger MYM-type protein 1-like [Ixodes scapularis]